MSQCGIIEQVRVFYTLGEEPTVSLYLKDQKNEKSQSKRCPSAQLRLQRHLILFMTLSSTASTQNMLLSTMNTSSISSRFITSLFHLPGQVVCTFFSPIEAWAFEADRDGFLSHSFFFLGVLIPGAGEATPVGAIKDFQIRRKKTPGPDFAVRTFTPTSPAPASGYPVLVYYHGGGWVLGNINTENVVCSRFCEQSKCVVVSVDYR
jgi:hypothetical protein